MLQTMPSKEDMETVPYSAEFKEAQIEYFIYRLEVKWECNVSCHNVCFCTTDGGHYPVSDSQLSSWASAITESNATLFTPSLKVLADIVSTSSADPEMIKPVKVSPSINHGVEMPMLAHSKSLRDKLHKVESTAHTGALITVARSSMNIVRFLGTSFLSCSDHIAMLVKYNQTISWIDKWEKIFTKEKYPTVAELDKDGQKVLSIIDNAVEMARPCYSPRVNIFGAAMGNRISTCLNLSTLAWDGSQPATSAWMLRLHILLAPLIILRRGTDPSCPDFVWALLKILKDDPIREGGSQAAPKITLILLSELAFSPYSPIHERIGQVLPRIIQLNCHVGPPSERELTVARFLLQRRMNSRWGNDPLDRRHWEIPIFEILATYEPSLREVVQGARGLPSIIQIFQTLGARLKLDVGEQIAYNRCLQYLLFFTRPYVKSIVEMEGIVASLVDAITKNGKKHPSNAPAAISIIHIISEGNPYILRQINSIGGDTKLREFQSTKIGGSRFVRILHERARVKAKEIDNRILNCISG